VLDATAREPIILKREIAAPEKRLARYPQDTGLGALVTRPGGYAVNERIPPDCAMLLGTQLGCVE
jgi:hypothetical protein